MLRRKFKMVVVQPGAAGNGGKQVAKLAGADPWFVFIRQCIIARFLVSPMIGHLPIEAEQFLEVRFEQGEFRALAGFTPGFSRVSADALKFFH